MTNSFHYTKFEVILGISLRKYPLLDINCVILSMNTQQDLRKNPTERSVRFPMNAYNGIFDCFQGYRAGGKQPWKHIISFTASRSRTSIELSTPWQSSHPATPSRHFSFPWPPVYIWLCSIHTKEERLFNKERICSFSTAYNRFTVYNKLWLLSVPKPTHALLLSGEPSAALLNQPRRYQTPAISVWK